MIKKNIAKKITAVAVGVVLSVMSCMTVFADYTYELGYSDDPCPRCGDTSVWVKEVHFSEPSATGNERKCPDHKYGTDIELEYHTIVYYDCRECKRSWSEDRYTYNWECHGYDKPYED